MSRRKPKHGERLAKRKLVSFAWEADRGIDKVADEQ